VIIIRGRPVSTEEPAHAGSAPPETFGGLIPGGALAAQIDKRIYEGSGDVTLTDTEAQAAAAVLDEWRQKSGAPDAVTTLYYTLASESADQEYHWRAAGAHPST